MSPRRCEFIRGKLIVAALLSASAWTQAQTAQAPSAEGVAFFENRIRPLLVSHCYSCHSLQAKAARKLKGHLFLDSREGWLKGGDSGPSLVPGKSKESLLIRSLHGDPSQMPPTGKLPEAAIADFTKWVDMGAPDPRTGNAAVPSAKRQIDIAEGKRFWSFRPLTATEPPAGGSTVVDRFVSAAQVAKGLKPNGPANKHTLIRRAYYDLIGLPPTPEQVAAFVNDPSPSAFEKVVDELLASPHYGERWGRHWLDAVRFAESGGYEFDGFRPGAHHYRDWVIKALNADMPYDEFVRRQLAGDRLAPNTYDGGAATGFIVAGPYPGQTTAKTLEKIRYDQLDDMVTTVGGAMLGLTMGCVRCHEHKYDPIPQQDYYGIAAAFARTAQATKQLDPDPAGTLRAAAEHAAKVDKAIAELRRFEQTELAAALDKWKQSPAAKAPATQPRWQWFDVREAESEKASLEPDDVVVLAKAQPKPKVKGRQARRPRAGANDAYTVVTATHQRNIMALRVEVLADKSLPKTGPGLGGDGDFKLMGVKVTAAPVDEKNPAKPVVLKLTALAATFENPKTPFKNLLDPKAKTGWSIAGAVGKDHAATFGIEGGVPAFEGGTELTFEFAFGANPGFGKFRLSFSTDESAIKPIAVPAKVPAEKAKAEPVATTKATNAPAAKVPAEKVPGEKTKKSKAAPVDKTKAAPAAPVEAATTFPTDGSADHQHGAELRILLAGKRTDPEETVRWLARFDTRAKAVFGAVETLHHTTPRAKTVEVYTAGDGGGDIYFLRRGETDNKAGKAQLGYLQVLSPAAPISTPDPKAVKPAPVDPRIALANWITDPKDGAGPLLARVIVNRLWQHHFGRGLVSTPNDFGAQGDRPSHPELLDWLAGELIRNGWRLKPIHRMLMTTAVYKQAGTVSEANQAIDPENRYLWYRKPHRLEAEIIRDALRSVAGELNLTQFGPGDLNEENPRRSVYLTVKRSQLIPFLQMFDAPDATASIGVRPGTTVPTQALALMNSPAVRQRATSMAARVRKAAGDAATAQIDTAYLIALARPPTTDERARLLEFFDAQRGTAPKAPDTALVEVCHLLLCLNEFVYVD